MAESPPLVFVAARMSSSRLPGKALMQFGDRPLLSHVVDAASSADGAGGVVVLTSREHSDDPIAEWCNYNSVDFFRGNLNDVAGRFLEAANSLGVESFVRVSGDSPMLDPRLISFAVLRFLKVSPDVKL